MKKFKICAVFLCSCAMAVSANSQTATKANPQLARGKYLVRNVGMCGECHTPMDKSGKPVKGQDLQGAPLTFQPTEPVPGWMAIAPQIAGLPGMTEDQAITFLTTGKKPDGAQAAPPMPAFRFNKADAAAITAYLKSLGSDASGK